MSNKEAIIGHKYHELDMYIITLCACIWCALGLQKCLYPRIFPVHGENVSVPGVHPASFLDPCLTGGLLGGALRGRTVQLFGRLAALETYTLRY